MDSSFLWRSCRVCENPVKTKTFWIFDYSFEILGPPQHIVSFFLQSHAFSRPKPFCSTSAQSTITLGTPCFNQGCGLRPSATPEKVWDCTISFVILLMVLKSGELTSWGNGSWNPIIYRICWHPNGGCCLGFQPSTLWYVNLFKTQLFVRRPFWWDSRPKGVPEGGEVSGCHCGWWIVLSGFQPHTPPKTDIEPEVMMVWSGWFSFSFQGVLLSGSSR